MDVSSYQPRDLTDLIGSLNPRPEHAVVRLYLPWERPPQSWSLDQIASARANGCSVGCYIWVYADADPVESIREALALAERADLEVPILWLDVETYNGQPGPGVEWLRAAADEAAAHGVQAGIYTGSWYVQRWLPDAAELADLPLWTADYRDIPDPDQARLYGGWTRAAGVQYNADYIDLDVFHERYTRRS